jgi:hypothetical protein
MLTHGEEHQRQKKKEVTWRSGLLKGRRNSRLISEFLPTCLPLSRFHWIALTLSVLLILVSHKISCK